MTSPIMHPVSTQPADAESGLPNHPNPDIPPPVFGSIESNLCKQHYVYVVGHANLQNTLFCKTLSRELGVVCSVVSDVGELKNISNVALKLFDVQSLGLSVAIQYVERVSHLQSVPSVAFINLSQSDDAMLKQRYRGWPALQGVFLQDGEPHMLFRGMRSILAGQIWISRCYLEAFAKRHGCQEAHSDDLPSIDLTRKERQVLQGLIKGNTNNTIADELCISPHTVKTHVYNLFRKINVDSRLEAVLWARKNVDVI